MAAHVDGFAGPLTVSQFKGGQSNPTYRLDTPSGRAFVLRRKPPGTMLPGAHAVEREARVMAALGAHRLPRPAHPRPVRGRERHRHALLRHGPGRRPDRLGSRLSRALDPTKRAAHFDAMNATIAQLHSFDPAAIGLGDYGRPAGFVERQVARWSKQYLADADAGRLPQMDALVDWLGKHLPPDSGDARIVHGDFRCDNMIFDADEPRVRAVLDWELSTLGDPARRLRLPSADVPHARGHVHRARRARPRRARHPVRGRIMSPLIAAAPAATHIADLDYLMVFVMFRLAAHRPRHQGPAGARQRLVGPCRSDGRAARAARRARAGANPNRAPFLDVIASAAKPRSR